MFYLIAALLSLLLFAWLKERVLYLIFPWAYVQNFVLAWMYTSGWASRDLCHALLLIKEFLLLGLFFYFLPRLREYGSGKLPLPVSILFFFTAWCVLRYLIAVIFQGEKLFDNLFNLRMACFPLQILTVAVGVARMRPDFAMRFIRQMAYLVSFLALVGIVLYIPLETTFWRDHVDFFSYTVDVKSESVDIDTSDLGEQQAAAKGVVGNGIARDEFSFLSPFRAMGTIGDAVGFGHLVAFPVLLLAFCLPQNWKTQLLLLVTLTALLFSFTRSAWIFALAGSGFVLLRKRRYRLVLGLVAVPAIALMIWPPMADWFSSSLDLVSSNTPDQHINGITWFYTQGIWDLHYLFGRDLSSPLVEGGYGILLIRFGLPAVLSIVWFCFALSKELLQAPLGRKPLFLVAQAVPLTMLVTLNFSAYQFGFIPYLLVWFAVGTCLAFATPVTNPASRPGDGA
jgi:hypothetical protein